MLAPEPQLAPASEWARYLAVFHRAFAAIEDYTRRQDKAGILLGGYLTDALHNVPAMLFHYSDNDWHMPARTGAYIAALPEQVQKRGAPDRIVEDCRRIVADTSTAQELGLREDLTDLDLAPLPKMREYLNCLYEACVDMRLIRNYGSRPSALQETVENITTLVTGQTVTNRSYTPWKGLERVWNAEADAQADYNGHLAAALRAVPSGLVQWSRFDEAKFRQTVLDTTGQLLAINRPAWTQFFAPKPD